ncbi:polysaccharide pyruvyl transferase family protein [Candidatus Gracilibacteria bacterium]|nr:polysaccharide pyruvyl transferase family protein [Candidatus Gracilibacteria bacterium]
MKNNKKRIFLIGSYGAGNIGDEAILQVISEKFLEKNIEIIPAIPHLPYRFFSIPFRLKTLWNLRKSDLVLLGGGGLFTDSDSQKAIKIWGKTIFWAELFGKKIFLFVNSIGPFYEKKSFEITKKYFEKIDFFSVRDEISFGELKKMGFAKKGEEEKIIFSDPVFSFKIPEKILEKKYLSEFPEKKHKIFAVSLRNLNNGNFNFLEFEKFLTEQEKKGDQILFVAMEDGDSVLFEKKFLKKGRIIFRPKNFSELLETLSEVDFCIGMRLHFLIASAILGKKILAISYSQKVRGIMEKIEINCLKIDEKNFLGMKNFFKKPKNISNEQKKFDKLIGKIEKILEN